MIRAVATVIGALLVTWAAFIAVLWLVRPDDTLLKDAARIVPDTLRLVSRLARDDAIGRGVRIRLWLLLIYLALPIDLVPDIFPVIGHADDLIITAFVLRSVLRHAGPGPIDRNWPGSPAGRTLLTKVCRLPSS